LLPSAGEWLIFQIPTRPESWDRFTRLIVERQRIS
jgi:hypothetical protein